MFLCTHFYAARDAEIFALLVLLLPLDANTKMLRAALNIVANNALSIGDNNESFESRVGFVITVGVPGSILHSQHRLKDGQIFPRCLS